MIYAVCIAMNVYESHDVWSRNLPMSSIREVLEEEIGVTEVTESEVTDVKFASEQGEWSLPRPGHVPPPLTPHRCKTLHSSARLRTEITNVYRQTTCHCTMQVKESEKITLTKSTSETKIKFFHDLIFQSWCLWRCVHDWNPDIKFWGRTLQLIQNYTFLGHQLGARECSLWFYGSCCDAEVASRSFLWETQYYIKLMPPLSHALELGVRIKSEIKSYRIFDTMPCSFSVNNVKYMFSSKKSLA